ncbi:hypothetical protein GCM10027290_62170 [Micromonospora sonneratiae]|uniref:ATP-grasp target RiPP n=1 Tax=Micromonospora sonneratiae TaxID=1184706 RepID=A0ABW3YD05_9ACTN
MGTPTWMQHARVYRLAEARVAPMYASLDASTGRPTIGFAVAVDDRETDFTAHPGESFLLCGRHWVIGTVEGAGSYDYSIRIDAVDADGPDSDPASGGPTSAGPTGPTHDVDRMLREAEPGQDLDFR